MSAWSLMIKNRDKEFFEQIALAHIVRPYSLALHIHRTNAFNNGANAFHGIISRRYLIIFDKVRIHS